MYETSTVSFKMPGHEIVQSSSSGLQQLGKASTTLTSKEEEHSISHGAEHGGEALSNDEGEQHVAGHIDCGAGSACLQWLNLTAQKELLPSGLTTA